jgi:dipeptidyl aminopeptidase/acylaminoacyl peptidase
MSNSPRTNSPQRAQPTWQPLDRIAIIVMLALSLLIGLLLLSGDHSKPRVREFTWQGRQVGGEDTAFILTFSRPMDRSSVETNLTISPPLPGKVSWAGRRMAYTLTNPAPYGRAFEVQLQNAIDRFSGAARAPIQPFKGEFKTRDRAFAYIGVEGEEAGRLVLYNLSTQQKQILTPPNLAVMEFLTYPLGDRLLFAATDRQAQGLVEQQLYSVSTGLQVNPPEQLNEPTEPPAKAAPPEAAGTMKLVLDNKDYQNLKFDLSANGQIIVVQRVSRSNPADFGPWLLREGEPPEPLKGNPGGDFLITPDSNSLAISQGQGLAILPLVPDAKPLDFLPKFGVVLDFSPDGVLATMVKFNADRTRSLFLVSSQGTQKELLRTKGSIFSAQFAPDKQTLYCLLSELITEGEIYKEEPYLASVDLKTGKQTPLVLLPDQFDTQVSIAPDGLAILLDQTTEAAKEPQQASQQANQPRSSSGKAIATSRLWLLPIDPTNPTAKSQPESLPLPGLRPRWLP